MMAFAIVAIHFRPNYNIEWQYPELFEWFIRLADHSDMTLIKQFKTYSSNLLTGDIYII